MSKSSGIIHIKSLFLLPLPWGSKSPGLTCLLSQTQPLMIIWFSVSASVSMGHPRLLPLLLSLRTVSCGHRSKSDFNLMIYHSFNYRLEGIIAVRSLGLRNLLLLLQLLSMLSLSVVSIRVGPIWVRPIPIQIYSPNRYFCRYRYICTNISATDTDIFILPIFDR